MTIDLHSVGGKRRYMGASEVWDFGWVAPDVRTALQASAHVTAVSAMPRFQVSGTKDDDPKKVCIWDLWKHPTVVKDLGFAYPGNHQLTGSCVGAGGGNACFSVVAVDVVRLNDPERVIIPFWLLPYGRSRYYLGDHSPGEGSTGSTFAKAVREDGLLDARDARVPQFKNTDGLIWGESVEMAWSDGDAKQTMDLLPESKLHLIQTTAPCKNADDVREAIRNYYPCSAASSWGGLMQCEVQGNPGVLMSRHATSWNHQMSIHAWWDHPSLGEIFWIQNNWGLDAHGHDPSGGPGGGFWVKKADVDWICNDGGEVFAFSQFQGFPAQSFSWLV